MHQLNLKFNVNLITRILLGFMLNQPRWTLREKRGWIWCWLFFKILINLNARQFNKLYNKNNKQTIAYKLETQLVPLLLYPLSLNFNYLRVALTSLPTWVFRLQMVPMNFFCVAWPRIEMSKNVGHISAGSGTIFDYRSTVIFENTADISVFIGIFTDFSGNFPIFSTSPARAQDTKSVQFFF